MLPVNGVSMVIRMIRKNLRRTLENGLPSKLTSGNCPSRKKTFPGLGGVRWEGRMELEVIGC